MNSINPNVFPKDGFYFIESDGAKIVGNSWTGVIARVANYRKRAGLPAGNVRDEVVAQACNRNPTICRHDDGGVREAQTEKASLKTRVLKWLDTLLHSKEEPDFVREQDAKNRMAVCAGCQFNFEIGGGCQSCKAALSESRKEILKGRRSDARVHSCLVLGEDNRVSVWLESQSVPNDRLPAHCWRKRT